MPTASISRYRAAAYSYRRVSYVTVDPAGTTYDVAPQSGPSGREQRIAQTGQRACLLVHADAICLHRVPSGEGIGGVYHDADTLSLRVSQDTPGAYEGQQGRKSDTTDEPSGRGALVPSRADEAPVLTVAAVASFAG